MSNVAGKAYAMNVVTPIRPWLLWLNRFMFWLAGTRLFAPRLRGLAVLSMIHYARWAIVRPRDFPRLAEDQPKETLRYTYMFFFSNFNGSWEQYVSSFSSAIPDGLDKLWAFNVGYPASVPLTPFNEYILHNQIQTDHYYNAYPLAASNDVKAGRRVKDALRDFSRAHGEQEDPESFALAYDRLVLSLQHDLSIMEKTPVVSLATDAVLRVAHDGS